MKKKVYIRSAILVIFLMIMIQGFSQNGRHEGPLGPMLTEDVSPMYLNYGSPTFNNPDYYYAVIKSAPTGTYYRQAGFSPDGTKIVAQKSWNDGSIGRTEVVLMNADGSGETVISPGNSGVGDLEQYGNPFWSDDGTAIGYLEAHSSLVNKVLRFVISTETTSYIYEPITPKNTSNADFLGNSTTSIVFWEYGTGGSVSDLFIWDGSTLTNITTSADYKEYEPISNGDGTKIVYWSGETTAEPVSTTHTLTYSGGVWTKDVSFIPIPNSYWAYWTTPAASQIAVTMLPGLDISIYNNAGTFVTDLTGPAFSGGSGMKCFFGSMPQGPNGEYAITSNAGQSNPDLARDIVIVNPRTILYVAASGSDANPGTQTAPFATIQKAINEAVAGGTVYVAAGIYNENLTISIPVNLIGADKTTTIIKGVSGDGRVVSVNGVTTAMSISGFTIDAQNCSPVKRGLQVSTSQHITIDDNIIIYYSEMGLWTLSNNIIRNNTINCAGTDLYGSIYVSGTDNIIDHNTITNFTTYGIYVNGGLVPVNQNNIITNNTLSDNMTAGSQCAIWLYNSGGNTIGGASPSDGNTFSIKPHSVESPSYCTGVKISTNPDGYITNNTIQKNIFDGGDRVIEVMSFVGGTTTFSDNIIGETTPPSRFGFMLNGGSAVISGNTFYQVPGPIRLGRSGGVAAMDVSITGNTFDGGGSNVAAIYAYNDNSVSVHQNKFMLDAGATAINNQSVAIDATCNWWGTPVGSDIAAMLSGGVDYSTVLLTDVIDPQAPGYACGPAWPNPVHNITTNLYYTTIQGAITVANSGNVIEVAPGTYTEQVTIPMSLTINGSGPTTIIRAPTVRANSVLINSDGPLIYDYVVAAYPSTGTINVQISDLVIDANGYDKKSGTTAFAGMLFRDVAGTGAGFFNSEIRNFGPDQYNFGLNIYGNSNLTVDGNTFTGYKRNGITAGGNGNGGSDDPVVNISDNSLTGSSISLNGIQLSWGAGGTVSGNIVQDHVVSSPWAGCGILISENTATVLINNNNQIDNCFDGIALLGPVSNVTMDGNNLTGIMDHGFILDNASNNIIQRNTFSGAASTLNAAINLMNGSTNNIIGGGIGLGNSFTLPVTGTGNLRAVNMPNTLGAGTNTISYNTFNGGDRHFQIDGGVTGTTTIDHNIFGNTIPPNFGAVIMNGGSAVISNNTMTNTVRPVESWGAINLTVSDNIISGSTYSGINLGYYAGTAMVDGNTISGVPNSNHGICAQVSGTGLTIHGNIIHDISGRGIQINGDAINANIDGNELFDVNGYAAIVIDGSPDHYATGAHINNNYVHDNHSGGMAINAQTDEFLNNRVLNNDYGIELGAPNATFVLHNNRIVGNDPLGTTCTNPKYRICASGLSVYDGTADATCNWWGSALLSEINPQITGNATYVPYNITEVGDCSGQPVQVTRAGVVISGHATIQAGVDAAIAGDVIMVAAGTYNEQVVIDGKNITMQGAGVTTIIRPSNAEKLTVVKTTPWLGSGTKQMAAILWVETTGGNVTLKDLKIDGVNITTLPTGIGSDDWVTGLSNLETSCLIENVTVENMNMGNTPRTCGIWNSAATYPSSVEVKNCSVTNYNRAGIYGVKSLLTVNFHNNVITGPGNLTVQVPNAIYLIDGCKGSVTYNDCSSNFYAGEEWKATGIGTYSAGSDVLFAYNNIHQVQNAFTLSNSISTIIEHNIIVGCTTGVKLEQNTTNAVIRNNEFTNGNYAIRCGDNMGTGNVAHNNKFTNLTGTGVTGFEGAVSVETNSLKTFNAINNYWGGNGPKGGLYTGNTGSAVSANVSFIPWWCSVEMNSACPPLDPGMIMMNTTTGEQYTAAELPEALSDAVSGQTLYIAEGTVSGTTYNYNGKTVYIIGTGIAGQSVLSGASPALTVQAGDLIVNNGITLYNSTDAPTILVTGGSLTLRDCIVHETPNGIRACLQVDGAGTVDAGTTASHGNNHFIIHGDGSAVDITASTIYKTSALMPAQYNDWGSANGPTVASNDGPPVGDGAAILPYDDTWFPAKGVDYNPFGGGPVTTITTDTICPSATYVDIPIKVKQLNDVGSFSLTFGFTPADLTTPTIQSRNAAFETNHWMNFAYTTDATMLAAGIYKVSGFTGNPDSTISLADNATLFTLRFNISGTWTTTNLTFNEDGQGTALEFTGPAPEFPPYGDMPTASNYFNGSVFVDRVAPIVHTTPGNISASTDAGLCSALVTYAAPTFQDNVDGTDLIGTMTAGLASGSAFPKGETTVTYTYTDFCNNGTANCTFTVTVNDDENPTVTAANDVVTTTSVGGTGDCAVDVAITDAVFNDNCPGSTLAWAMTGATTGSGSGQVGTKTFNKGITTITFTVSDAGSPAHTATDLMTITVTDDETPSISCPVSGDQTVNTNTNCTYVIGTNAWNATASDNCGVSNLTYSLSGVTTGTGTSVASVAFALGTTTVTWTATDAANNQNVCSFTVTVSALTVDGYFNYYNLANTPLGPVGSTEVTIQLYKDNAPYGSPVDITNTNGSYQLTGVCTGIYQVRPTSTMLTAGAINATDAAQANYWGAHPYQIEKVRFYAGDVQGSPNGDKFIGGLDASRIQANFVNGTPFDRTGGWTFWNVGDVITANFPTPTGDYPTITVGSANISANFYGLCVGDFNRSFNPGGTKASSSTMDLVYAGNRQISNNQEFDLPINMVSASEVGAVSLILNFPADMVEVQDVTMEGAGGQLDWAVKGNELRIGWNSPVPAYLSAGSELVTLKLKTTEAFTTGNSIRLTLAANPLNELADGMYDVIGNAVLGVDVIEASTTGTPELDPASYALSLSSYPNPFKNFTTITYTLPFDGQVTLEVYNFLGMKVEKLVSEEQTAGNHVVRFNTAGMESGVYTATLVLKSNEDQLFRTIKLVYNK